MLTPHLHLVTLEVGWFLVYEQQSQHHNAFPSEVYTRKTVASPATISGVMYIAGVVLSLVKITEELWITPET